MKLFSTLLLFFLLSNFLSAQTFQRQNIPFKINGTTLQNPLTGGLNAPQFSEVDLNNDGKQDLYIFDRVGNVHLPFLNIGGANESKYEFVPNFIKQFPNAVNWVQLRDFNGDNIPDLFAHAGDENVDGAKVYKGFYSNNKIGFERVDFDNDFPFDVLTYPLNNDLLTQIPIDGEDYPNINDVDGDGDLDILSFIGGYVQFYENQAVEGGLGLDALIFELKDECWGRFFESSTASTIKLSDDIDMCAEPLVGDEVEDRSHPGSTLLTFDEDGDGDVEIMIGDSGNPFITRLSNGGDTDLAFMTDQDPNFPDYDMTAFVPFFPATFYLDLNNDNKKDLIVSPSSLNITENTHVAWLYQNTGTANVPIFEFQQSDFLVEEMLDFGTNAYPSFADVTGDGLLDLVVGNNTFYKPGGEKDARLLLFENIGNATNPSFDLIDDNWLDFKQFSESNINFSPTFGDLDNDGDLDLVVGHNFGGLFFSENEGGAGNPMVFNDIEFDWQQINVGQNSYPQIVDLNRDGLMDLVIGEKQGNLNYFPNQGTFTEPVFISDPSTAPNISKLGNVDLGILGNSIPAVLGFGDEFKIVIGSENGTLHLYDNIENNLDGDFNLVNNNFGKIEEGVQVAPAIADLNNDGFLDALLGNRRGGLVLYESNMKIDGTTSIKESIISELINIAPNPVQNELKIRLDEDTSPELIQILDVFGKVVFEELNIEQKSPIVLNVNGLPDGAYFIRIQESNRFLSSKFLKM